MDGRSGTGGNRNKVINSSVQVRLPGSVMPPKNSINEGAGWPDGRTQAEIPLIFLLLGVRHGRQDKRQAARFCI